MNPDGTNVTQLTKNAASDFHPAWSPDGRKIAFTSSRDGDLEVYTMAANGGDQIRRTTNGADDTGPDWQPRRRR